MATRLREASEGKNAEPMIDAYAPTLSLALRGIDCQSPLYLSDPFSMGHVYIQMKKTRIDRYQWRDALNMVT